MAPGRSHVFIFFINPTATPSSAAILIKSSATTRPTYDPEISPASTTINACFFVRILYFVLSKLPTFSKKDGSAIKPWLCLPCSSPSKNSSTNICAASSGKLRLIKASLIFSLISEIGILTIQVYRFSRRLLKLSRGGSSGGLSCPSVRSPPVGGRRRESKIEGIGLLRPPELYGEEESLPSNHFTRIRSTLSLNLPSFIL